MENIYWEFIARAILTDDVRQALENIRYEFIMCRRSISCTEELSKINDNIVFYSAMSMYHIWTASYLLNQTHIATIGTNNVYRFDEKGLKPFFPADFEDRYKFKTIGIGNYESGTELNYHIGEMVN